MKNHIFVKIMSKFESTRSWLNISFAFIQIFWNFLFVEFTRILLNKICKINCIIWVKHDTWLKSWFFLFSITFDANVLMCFIIFVKKISLLKTLFVIIARNRSRISCRSTIDYITLINFFSLCLFFIYSNLNNISQ